MMAAVPIALAAALAATQAVPAVPAEQDEFSVLFTVSTSPDECNVSLATRVNLLELAKEPAKWAGKCVAVDGYWQHRALFASRRDTRLRAAQSNQALKARRVGIYGTDELLASAPRRPRAHMVIGVAGECETLGKGAVMVMGYCHYTGGPYIAVAEVRRR